MATSKTGAARLRRLSAGLAVAAAVMLAGGGFVHAEAARLTQSTVKRFISSYPDVRSLALNRASSQGEKVAGSANPLMAVVEAASDKSLRGQLDGAVQRHGFRDSKEWMGVARSVGQAYAHMKAGSSGDAKANEKVEKAIAKIEKNDLLPDKQKKKLIEAIREGAGAVLEPPPPENMAVVKAMAPEIEAVVK
jgi:hypothetical protein